MKLSVFKSDGTLATWSMGNGKRLSEVKNLNNYEEYTSYNGAGGYHMVNQDRALLYHNEDLEDFGDEESYFSKEQFASSMDI